MDILEAATAPKTHAKNRPKRDSNFKSKHTSKKHRTPEGRQHRERETTMSTMECVCEDMELRTQFNQDVKYTIHTLGEKRKAITARKQGQAIMK